ncbi:hypothetical protein F4802DRAFT_579232 [Xylaria palmicola]|nr:hypothetical protein F4802DRAFT_579232 [Xylaria palmicola]
MPAPWHIPGSGSLPSIIDGRPHGVEGFRGEQRPRCRAAHSTVQLSPSSFFGASTDARFSDFANAVYPKSAGTARRDRRVHCSLFSCVQYSMRVDICFDSSMAIGVDWRRAWPTLCLLARHSILFIVLHVVMSVSFFFFFFFSSSSSRAVYPSGAKMARISASTSRGTRWRARV